MAGNNKQIILNEKSDIDVLEEMMSSNYGEHNILVYPDKTALRDIYSCYCKSWPCSLYLIIHIYK